MVEIERRWRRCAQIHAEEFKKLQAIRADEEQRIKLGWWGLERLLAEIHRRPGEPSSEEIETDGSTEFTLSVAEGFTTWITAARQELNVEG